MNYTFRFAIRNNPNKLGLCQLFIDARLNAVRVRFALAAYVPKQAFNAAKQMVQTVPGFSLANKKKINQLLDSYQTKCNQIIEAALEKDVILTKEKWLNYLTATNFTDFVSFADAVIAKKLALHEITPPTAKTYRNALAHVVAMYGPMITFNQLGDVARELEGHLIKVGLGKNTRKKVHTRIKTIILQAQKEGIALQNPYEHFKIGTIKGNRVALNMDEFERLIALYRTNELPDHYQNVLQYFLFSCLTGTRYSDIKHLSSKNIQGQNLVFTPVKTKRLEKQINMRIPAPAFELIKGCKGQLFTPITAQKTNENLKELMKYAKIYKHITFHCARHTFGTLFIHLGGDVSVLQALMGHAKIETTSEYLHLAESLKKQSVTLFDGV